MSAAAAATAEPAPKKRGKKKLVVILAAVLVLLLAAGGGALFLLKKQAAAAAEEEHGDEAVAQPVKREARPAPVFVPLEPFTVNLADRDGERYAQIGLTLEVTDAKVGDELKAYMPAIRNNILMLLAHKTSEELLHREGKERLAVEIRRETLRPLGYEVPADVPAPAGGDAGKAGDKAGKAAKTDKAALAAAALPVQRVHFSNFIIQ